MLKRNQIDLTTPDEQRSAQGVDEGLHDPRADVRRTEAVLDPSATGVVHEAAG
jgi:hypothetical protein